MPQVYVTQLPHKRDNATGQLVPIFNISPAQEFGELVFMMPPQAHFQPPTDIVQKLSASLKDYDHEAGDAVLLLGDTILIAATCAILARRHRQVAVLRWDRQLGRYTRVTVAV